MARRPTRKSGGSHKKSRPASKAPRASRAVSRRVSRARSAAAQKGWRTRRRNARERERQRITRQTLRGKTKQQKARLLGAIMRRAKQRVDYLVTVNFTAPTHDGGLRRYSRSLIVPSTGVATRREILTQAKVEAPAALAGLLQGAHWSRAEIARGPSTFRRRTEER